MLVRIASLSILGLLAACTDNLPQAARDLPEPGSAGAMLLEDKCGNCHGAPHPDVHTAKMWPAVLHRMQNRMTMKAYKPLSDEDFAVLLDYLQQHAGPESK